MSDIISQSLVDKLLASGTARAYLPSGFSASNGTSMMQNQVGRPEVDSIAQEYFEDPQRLYGDKVANNVSIAEKPIHRAMIFAHARGATARDIAQNTGFHYSTVCQILRQPWARLRLVQILNETGMDAVKHFLSTEVSPSLEVLREVRDNPLAKASEKISAANSILDRALGKPTVHVESDNTNRSIPTDMARIDAELASLRKQVEGAPASS